MDSADVLDAPTPPGEHVPTTNHPPQFSTSDTSAQEKPEAKALLEPSTTNVPRDSDQSAKHRLWLKFLSAFRRDVWLLEIASLLVTVGCLVAIIAVLRKYENKPNPEWPSGLTLNVVVSWISTIFKTCLLMPVGACISQLSWTWFGKETRPLADACYYDEASRGPMGSLKLLLRLKASHVACIGAGTTLLALGLDPFFQQTIKYSSQAVIDPSSKAQALASYTYNGSYGYTLGGEISNIYALTPYNLRSAMLSGLLASTSLPPPNPPYLCPSGNCTWDPFSTLAIGVRCTDVSSHVKINCTTRLTDPTAFLDGTCGFTAPDDHTLSNMVGNGSAPNMMLSLASYEPQIIIDSGWDTSNITGLISGVQWVKAVKNIYNYPVSQNGAPPWIVANTTAEAYKCLFHFSVREIGASVRNGIYTERILNEYTNNSATSPAFPDAFRNLVYKPPFAKGPPNRNDTFAVLGESYAIIGSEFTNLMEGSVRADENGFNGTGPQADTMLLIWMSQNTKRTMENMALYMTNALRTNDSALLAEVTRNNSAIAPDQAVLGTVWIQKQFVVIRWAWLTMPAALIVAVAALLLITMVRTSRSRAGVWKSSPLALFFHGNFDGNGAYHHVSNGGESVNTVDAMEDVAARLDARLIGSGGDAEVTVSRRAK